MMQRSTWGTAGAILLTATILAGVARGEPQVYLELVTGKTFPIEGAQELIRKFSDIGADNLKIRQATDEDRPLLKTGGTERSPIYYVTGVVDSRGRLLLPGTTLSINSPSSVRQWIEKLKAGGEEGLTARPGAFGLSGKELLELHEKLAAPVGFATKGKSARDVAAGIIRATKVKVGVDPSATEALQLQETVGDELEGVSTGTALAAVLRPLGLVIVPQKMRTGEVGLVIVDSRRSEESWPVGWPTEKSEKDLIPALYKFIPVEITDFALSDALDALQKRLEVPFLYDHNSLARHGIEPSESKVSHPKVNTYYKRVIDRLLSQVKLKAEVRVDEAGKPLIWVSTIQR